MSISAAAEATTGSSLPASAALASRCTTSIRSATAAWPLDQLTDLPGESVGVP